MKDNLRLFMVKHGAIVAFLGSLSGLAYTFVITGDIPGSRGQWHLAHLQGVLTGILILAASSCIDGLGLSLKLRRIAACLFVITGYCYSIGPVWGAVFSVRGLQPVGPLTNLGMFMSNTIASIGVLIALGLTIKGTVGKKKDAGK